MRTCVLALVMVLLACVAHANPVELEDNIYLDLGGSNCYWPAGAGILFVDVLLGDLSEHSEGGIASISFRFERTFSGFLMESIDLLGGGGWGSVEAEGWTSLADDGCGEPNGWGSIPVARFMYYYNGSPGTIEVQAHQLNGATFETCDSADTYWWNNDMMDYVSYAGVGMEAAYGCGPVTAVNDLSWGAIKALYR